MATQLRIRRDSFTDLGSVVPAEAELIYDQTNNRLGIGDGSSDGDARALFALMQGDLHKMAPIAATAGGTGNALTVTLDPVPASYVAFMTLLVKASANNTGAATVNVNSLGAKAIKKNGGADDVEADDIVSGGIYLLIYDGTNFQVISGAGAAAGGGIAQVVESTTTTAFSITASIPEDDTIPQSSEGTEVLTRTITPTDAASTFLVEAELPVGGGGTTVRVFAALFTDSNANAVAAAGDIVEAVANAIRPMRFSAILPAFGDTSSHTIKLRVGTPSGTAYVNRDADNAALFGGVLFARLRVMEILPA